VLAAPLAKPARVPLLLWYTHWNASRSLRVATRLADRILSVDARSFPLDSAKVRAIGHGIDLDEFPCRPRPTNVELRLLALGRYSPAKGLDVVLRALRRLLDRGVDVRLDAYGPVLSPLEERHRAELDRLRDDLRLGEAAQLHGPVERSQVSDLLAANDALVNNMRAGAPDKVVYEAAAACLPVLASNPVFDELFGEFPLHFERDDPASLAERLRWFISLSPDKRAEIGHALRERVAARHSVDTWADGVLAAVR
jgi:glycosyltransferase involved in cell wall biosynthesis